MQSLTEKQKHDILSMVLRESVKSFSNELLSTYLSLIIDEHQDPTNISVLQDVILQELVKHREQNYSKFIQCEKKKQTKSVVIVKKKQSNTQKALIKLNKLYKQSLDDKNSLKQKYKLLADKSKELQMLLLSQIRLYKEKEKELEEYKSNSILTEIDNSSTSPEYDSLFNVHYAE
jgi:hypothetical protein